MTENEIAAYKSICKIEKLLTKADALFNTIPTAIQQTIYDYHNEAGTIQHCLRWGLQAMEEIRNDWHKIIVDTRLR